MLEFAGHGENDGTEGIAGGPGGVGSLFGMATLPPLPTARTEAGFDVELSDDRHDGGQIGLVLYDDFGIDQRDVALGAKSAWHGDGTVDVFRRGDGPEVRLVSSGSAWFFLAYFQFVTAEMPGLTMWLSACLVEILAQAAIVLFQEGHAAPQMAEFVF